MRNIVVVLFTGGVLMACESTPATVARSSALQEHVADQEEGVRAPEDWVTPEGIEGQPIFVQGVVLESPTSLDDLDHDGVPAEQDFDDENPFAFPGAVEVPCNDLDEDGDLVDICPADADDDEVRADRDCDDLDARVNQLAPEVDCDGIDQNCDGLDDCDRDQDGVLDQDDLDPDDPLLSSTPREVGELN